METFTAKQIHDDPTPVYQASIEAPIKLSHKHHGEFIMIKVPKGAVVREMNISRGGITLEIDSPTNKPLANYDASRFPALERKPITQIINPRFDCTPKVKSTPWAGDES